MYGASGRIRRGGRGRARQSGSVMTEYVLVTALVTMGVWLAAVGGNGGGSLFDAMDEERDDYRRVIAVDNKDEKPEYSQATTSSPSRRGIAVAGGN